MKTSAIKAYGFTMAELISTMVVIGILAAVAIPRFISKSGFESRGFYDDAQTIVRYAQKIAIAQNRTIYICITATAVTAASDSACSTPLTHPGTGAALSSAAPAGVTLSATQFAFDKIGRTVNSGTGQPLATPVTVTFSSTIPDDPARQMIVERETGYVRHN